MKPCTQDLHFLLVPVFHFVDSLVPVGWLFVQSLRSQVRQHFTENVLFVTLNDIIGKTRHFLLNLISEE